MVYHFVFSFSSMWFSHLCPLFTFAFFLKNRCLHELRPHGGRPLSCLLFCDNHKRQDPEWVCTHKLKVQIYHRLSWWVFIQVHLCVFFLLIDNSVPFYFSLQGSFLAISDNWSWPKPGVEDVVHCFLDLFTNHQVSIIWNTFFSAASVNFVKMMLMLAR